jgi:hypothetical protein
MPYQDAVPPRDTIVSRSGAIRNLRTGHCARTAPSKTPRPAQQPDLAVPSVRR